MQKTDVLKEQLLNRIHQVRQDLFNDPSDLAPLHDLHRNYPFNSNIESAHQLMMNHSYDDETLTCIYMSEYLYWKDHH